MQVLSFCLWGWLRSGPPHPVPPTLPVQGRELEAQVALAGWGTSLEAQVCRVSAL